MKITDIDITNIDEISSPEELADIMSMISLSSVNPDPADFPRYHESDIIDENKSVKWNREEVANANMRYYNERDRLRSISYEMFNKVEARMIDVLSNDNDLLNRAQIALIWDKSRSDFHDNGPRSVLANYYEYEDFAEHLIREGDRN